MLNVGLLGAGRISRVHATAITAHPGSTLAAVSDVNTQSSEKLAQEYSSTARSTEEIIADRTIDAVLIATPTDTHSDLIEAATEAGKAVLCEKPVDLDLERARECRKAIAGRDQPVMIGFNRRFDRHFSALRTALWDGDVGSAELLSITSFDPAPPPIEYARVSGGLFRDMMIHDFDMTNYIMGELPVTVSASGSSLIDPQISALGDVDTAVVTLVYPGGQIAVIKNSRRAVYGHDQRLEVLGSNGLLQATNVLENNIVTSTVSGVSAAKPVNFFLERYMQSYSTEWAAFVETVKTGMPPPVTLDDGINALMLAEAATRSVKSKTPVNLDTLVA